jgi:membrane protease YdiL (CAAX protease family)
MSHSSPHLFDMRPGSKMALLIALTGIGLIVGGFLAFSFVAAWLHVGLRDIQSYLLQPQYASLMQLANALASIIAFGFPSIVLALLSRGKLVANLGFKNFSSKDQIGWVILLAITGLLLSGALGDLSEKIPVSASIRNWATQLEDQYKKALYAMTQMHSMVDLGIALLAVAVVPAIVEELFFRATLQKTIIEWSGKPILSIVITAIIFSAFHFSYFGFLSRMSLGIVLGLVYYYTKNIGAPMLMHFINNGIGVSALYFVRQDPQKTEKVVEGNFSYYWAIVALVVIFYLIQKIKNSSHAGLEKSL